MVYFSGYVFWGVSTAFKSGDPSTAKHIPFNPLKVVPTPDIQEKTTLESMANSLVPSIAIEELLETGSITLTTYYRDPFLLLAAFGHKTVTAAWSGTGDVITGDNTDVDHLDYIWMQVHVEDQSGDSKHLNYLFDGGQITSYKWILEAGKFIMEEVTIEFAEHTLNSQAINVDNGFDDGTMDLTGAAEVSTVVAVAKASLSQDEYFTIQGISAALVRTDYYVWMDLDGSNDGGPAPSGFTEIRCDIQADTTAQNVSDTITAAIDAVGNFGAANGGGASTTVTITNANNGDVKAIADVDTGMTVAVTTQGKVDLDGGWSLWDDTYAINNAAQSKDATITCGTLLDGMNIKKVTLEAALDKAFEPVLSSKNMGLVYNSLRRYTATVEGIVTANDNHAQVLLPYTSKTKATFKIAVDDQYLQFTVAFLDKMDPMIEMPEAGKALESTWTYLGGVSTALSYNWTGNEATDPSNLITH